MRTALSAAALYSFASRQSLMVAAGSWYCVMTNETYRPIDCALHDVFELAIMQARKLTVEWQDADGCRHTGTILAKDTLVRNGEEFLLAESLHDGRALCIRFDRIALIDSGG